MAQVGNGKATTICYNLYVAIRRAFWWHKINRKGENAVSFKSWACRTTRYRVCVWFSWIIRHIIIIWKSVLAHMLRLVNICYCDVILHFNWLRIVTVISCAVNVGTNICSELDRQSCDCNFSYWNNNKIIR